MNCSARVGHTLALLRRSNVRHFLSVWRWRQLHFLAIATSRQQRSSWYRMTHVLLGTYACKPLMSIEHLHPFAGDHAIQSAIVVVEWGSPDGAGLIMAERMQALQDAALPQLANLGLVNSEQIRVVEFQFGAGPAAAHPSQALGGFKVSRLSSPGVELRSLVMAREHCIIQINDYSRWLQVKRDIHQYLNIILPLVGSSAPVRHLSLQFNDVFLWQAPSIQLHLVEVFRRGSAWLPPHIFDLQNLWHSHHGYFADHIQPCAFRQLDNVNVSRAFIDGVESIQALVAHRASLDSPLWIKQPYPDAHEISIVLDKFHDDNKNILAALFSDGVLQKIKLLPN